MALLGALLAAAPAMAADPQPYTVTIEGSGASDLDATLNAASQLVSLRDTVAVPPFALIGRAKADIPRLQAALDSYGYYANNVTVSIDGRSLDDPSLPALLDAVPRGKDVDGRVSIKPGILYRIGNIELNGELPPADRESFPLHQGDPAVAAKILDAQSKLLSELENHGYAFAKVEGPSATADDASHTIDVAFAVSAGKQVEIGEVKISGLENVNESFARRALTIGTGDRYDPRKIEVARQALLRLGVFIGVNVRAADKLSSDGRLPLTFQVSERPQRIVTLSGTYSTDLGINLAATWSHRNLFGNAEQLNLTASGSSLGSASTGLGYDLAAKYIEPFFIENDQILEFDLEGLKQDLVAYNQRAEIGAGYVRRTFSPEWKAGVGLVFAHHNVNQEGHQELYQLLALPITANYDSTGNSDLLQDPRQGARASLAVTPTRAFGAGSLGFLVVQGSASPYFDVSGDGRSVVALRAIVGDIIGGSNLSLPPDQRLYLGGSQTVRGFAYQTIGPLFPDGKPVGAKAVDAASVEFRQRFLEDWGAALFVDAGQASAAGVPFTGLIRVGAGAGLRYYTPIGPVRLDFALPVTRIPGGDAFEIYIGLGQAF